MFITCSASSPGSAEPLTAITRSELVSQRAMTSGPSSRIRVSITGTTISALGRQRAIAASVASGSKRRWSTSVEDSARPSVKCA